MIKSLRRKFIAVVMLSVTLVIILILSLINIANFRQKNSELDFALSSMIAEDESGGPGELSKEEDGGSVDEEKDTSSKSSAKKKSVLRDDASASGRSGRIRDFRRDILMTPDSKGDYFYVRLTEGSADISEINIDRAKDIREVDAAQKALMLYSKGKDYGIYDGYKFAVSYDEDNEIVTYSFLDCSDTIGELKSFAVSSIVLAVLAEILIYLLVAFLSRPVTRPAQESIEKQKRFITDASHELKTPLAIIEANTEVMELTDGENDWTRSNRRQIERLSSLIEKLVFLSRMDEENSEYMTMTDFDLSEAVTDTIDGFRTSAEAKGHAISTNIPVGITYHGDEGNIRQLFSLLLDNAIKYADEGGDITINITTREHGKNRIRITQSNPAPGLKTGRLDELFDRFYRADESRSSEKGGHGIGLSVARAIVMAHKGEIHAESRDGRNIIFTIYL